jgi:hypothetical protein
MAWGGNASAQASRPGTVLPADQQEGDLVEIRNSPNRPTEGSTVEPGYHDVADDEIDPGRARQVKRFETIVGLEDSPDLQSRTPQAGPQVVPHVGVVINQQHGAGSHR